MRRRFSLLALIASSGSAVLFTATWFVLNQFRREYYNSSVEGPSAQESSYWTIIRVQDFLEWPIKLAFCFAALSLLFELAHFIVVIARKISHKQGPV